MATGRSNNSHVTTVLPRTTLLKKVYEKPKSNKIPCIRARTVFMPQITFYAKELKCFLEKPSGKLIFFKRYSVSASSLSCVTYVVYFYDNFLCAKLTVSEKRTSIKK